MSLKAHFFRQIFVVFSCMAGGGGGGLHYDHSMLH